MRRALRPRKDVPRRPRLETDGAEVGKARKARDPDKAKKNKRKSAKRKEKRSERKKTERRSRGLEKKKTLFLFFLFFSFFFSFFVSSSFPPALPSEFPPAAQRDARTRFFLSFSYFSNFSFGTSLHTLFSFSYWNNKVHFFLSAQLCPSSSAASFISSRPTTSLRISEVPAPISYSFASRRIRPVGFFL